MMTLPIVDQQQPNQGEEKKEWYQDEEMRKKLEVRSKSDFFIPVVSLRPFNRLVAVLLPVLLSSLAVCLDTSITRRIKKR